MPPQLEFVPSGASSKKSCIGAGRQEKSKAQGNSLRSLFERTGKLDQVPFSSDACLPGSHRRFSQAHCSGEGNITALPDVRPVLIQFVMQRRQRPMVAEASRPVRPACPALLQPAQRPKTASEQRHQAPFTRPPGKVWVVQELSLSTRLALASSSRKPHSRISHTAHEHQRHPPPQMSQRAHQSRRRRQQRAVCSWEATAARSRHARSVALARQLPVSRRRCPRALPNAAASAAGLRRSPRTPLLRKERPLPRAPALAVQQPAVRRALRSSGSSMQMRKGWRPFRPQQT